MSVNVCECVCDLWIFQHRPDALAAWGRFVQICSHFNWKRPYVEIELNRAKCLLNKLTINRHILDADIIYYIYASACICHCNCKKCCCLL